MVNHLSPIQHKLLETFKYFVQFCSDHNLKYYAAFGTCLGAVRHHGFIPWDDDMDVYMMRSDYEKLLSLKNNLADAGKYRVSDILDGEHPYPFAKFYSTDCTVWEMRQFPFIIGPWIDVFPIDEWNDSEKTSRLYDDYHVAMWNYRKALSYQTWKEIWSDLFHLRGSNGLIKLVKQCIYKPFKRCFYKKVHNLQEQIKEVKGDQLKSWSEVKNEIYEKDWFKTYKEVPFEETLIRIPIGFDAYLKHRYGDYMTPPPKEKQVANHSYYFIDLNKVWSQNEIETNLMLRKTERRPLSFKVIVDELRHKKGFTRIIK